MGWTTRGTDKTYDSLTGSAALIGYFSKKVLSCISLNRKCKSYDSGHEQTDHDCRLNFEGFAKAMEPYAAVQLTLNNLILKKYDIQIGILIPDNDSSSISVIRGVCSHEVVKQADKSHTSKGLVNELYKINKKYKELTGLAIKYLQKCFNYCIAQNAGNLTSMAAAIRNIPHHCFNNHKECESWCNYHQNPKRYSHSVIKDGFKNPDLFHDLKSIFDILANKTSAFAAETSSNPNESLNAMFTSKAPKSRLYGMSATGDFRVASAISKKNCGEQYLLTLYKNLSLSPGRDTEKYNCTNDANAKKRYERSLTRSFKRRRLFKKNAKQN